MIELGEWRLLAVFIVGVVGAIIFSELGRLLVRRRRVGKGTDTIETAVLGMLALMIGFTFAMALSRFDARRDALMNEANAIGITALRLMPAHANRRGYLFSGAADFLTNPVISLALLRKSFFSRGLSITIRREIGSR